MSTTNVLVIVDTEAAMVGGPEGAVYMVDTQHFMGSYAEGSPALVTTVTDGQRLVWSIAPIDPDSDVKLTNVSASALCHPTSELTETGTSWAGIVEAPPGAHTADYTVSFSIDGQTHSLDQQILAVAPSLRSY